MRAIIGSGGEKPATAPGLKASSLRRRDAGLKPRSSTVVPLCGTKGSLAFVPGL